MATLRKRLEIDLREAKRERQELDKRLAQKPDFGLGKGSAGADSWEMSLARKQRVKERIEALQDALDRVRAGTYGRCHRCGAKINPERLEILPTTSLCVACAGAANANSPEPGGA